MIKLKHQSSFKATISVEGFAQDIYFESTVEISKSADFLVPAFLPPLMSQGVNFRASHSVSDDIVASATYAQRQLAAWYPNLHEISFPEQTRNTERTISHGVACFFSGGVDSFHSVIQNLDEVTHLVFIVGFDIELDNKSLIARALSELQEAASRLGKEFIVVTTNLRSYADLYSDWGTEFHGAALVSVAHLLKNHFSKIVIPSSYQTDELFPWASHPDLDPLWSTQDLEVIHDSTEPYRHEKVGYISTNEVALSSLRVCWKNSKTDLNCGKCEKCIRTMIALKTFDALDKCSTLPETIDFKALRRVRPTKSDAKFAEANIRLLKASNNHENVELIEELESLISRVAFWDKIRSLRIWPYVQRLKRSISG